MEQKIWLAVSDESKSIPYRKEERNDSINNGFINLKKDLKDINRISEVNDGKLESIPIKNILTCLNKKETVFFTVGCEKQFNIEEEIKKYCLRGYIELAYNYEELAKNIFEWYSLFDSFNGYLWRWQKNFSDMAHYHWIMMGANFTEKNINGSTMTIWITTPWLDNDTMCLLSWNRSWKVLEEYLLEVSKQLQVENASCIY